jgi:hypothetical protein
MFNAWEMHTWTFRGRVWESCGMTVFCTSNFIPELSARWVYKLLVPQNLIMDGKRLASFNDSEKSNLHSRSSEEQIKFGECIIVGHLSCNILDL